MSIDYVIYSDTGPWGGTSIVAEVEGGKFRLHITETDERGNMEGRYIYPGTPEDFA